MRKREQVNEKGTKKNTQTPKLKLYIQFSTEIDTEIEKDKKREKNGFKCVRGSNSSSRIIVNPQHANDNHRKRMTKDEPYFSVYERNYTKIRTTDNSTLHTNTKTSYIYV